MKQFFTLLAAAMFTSSAFAQLPNGSIAPDFTLTDINGQTHNLYSYLNQGKSVILDFSATWCGPCWDLHQEGTLKDLYNVFGPDGTDDLMVLKLECDPTTGLDDLNGTGPATVGDWLTGTPYPILDGEAVYGVSEQYLVPGYPTWYTVCPAGTVTQSDWNGQGYNTLAQHAQIAFGDCGNVVTEPAGVIDYDGDEVFCAGSWEASVSLQNLGNQPLTSAEFEVNVNGSSTTVDWNGNLQFGATTSVSLGDFTSNGNCTTTLTELNGQAKDLTTSAEVAGAVGGTNMLVVRITPDCFCMPNILGPGETSWQILNENGGVIESVDFNNINPETGLNYQEGVEYTWIVNLPSFGCYSFRMLDSYGDGLNGCQYTGNDCNTCGSARVWSYDGTTQVSTIVNFDGASFDNGGDAVAFEELIANFEVKSSSTNVSELDFTETLEVFPNPAVSEAQVVYTLGQVSDVVVELTSSLGQLIESQKLGNMSVGEHRTVLNLNGLDAGIYNVVVRADDRIKVMRITKK